MVLVPDRVPVVLALLVLVTEIPPGLLVTKRCVDALHFLCYKLLVPSLG